MPDPIVITSLGMKKLEEELEYLVTVKRREIADAIKQAREYGDLSENSEYDEVKNEQAVVEQRIAQIESMFKNIKVVDVNEIDKEKVSIGSTVRVFDKEYDEEVVYTIVGSTEADPMLYKISYESPVGKALLGNSVGDEVVAHAPAGDIRLEILAIEV